MSDAELAIFKVIVYLGRQKPQSPIWVRATGRDDARDQVEALLGYGDPNGEVDGVRLYVFSGPAAEPTIYLAGTDIPTHVIGTRTGRIPRCDSPPLF